MKDSFDRGIKQKLENLTPEELGYHPDREKMWMKISPGKKPKIISFPSWVTHAAAIAAGLLIGAFFLNRHQQDPEHKPAIANNKSTQLLPQKVAIKTDTVYVLQSVEKQKSPERTPASVTQKQQQPQESFIAQQEHMDKETNPVSAIAAEGAIAVNPPATQRKVLHLSDMDNENAIPKPKPKNLAFFKILSNSNQPENNQTTISMLMGQRLAAAKN